MGKIIISFLVCFATAANVVAQSNTTAATPSQAVEVLPAEQIVGVGLPILFISFLVFMLTSLVKYFLDFRLKSKLIERGMSEQLSAYLLSQYDKNNHKEVVKLAILCCGMGVGLTMVYLTAPVHIHSLAIMAFSLALSYLAYFFYLRR